MTELITFENALDLTKGAKKSLSLLLGNGFSIRFFHYKNLLDNSEIESDHPIREVFKLLDTYDFERVIRSLEEAALVEKAYCDYSKAEQFDSDSEKVRQALIHAIRATHPMYRNDIRIHLESCLAFLNNFVKVFTLNYDLLLYWITLENTQQFADGFGLAEESNGFLRPFKANAKCNVHYLHGGLHLFTSDDGEIEKRLKGSEGLVEAVTNTIKNEKRLPLYVAEGRSVAKLRKINSNKYLSCCLDRLRSSGGNLLIYGHSADTNDAHIYNAIFNSKVNHVYFSVHKPTADVAKIEGELSRYQKLFSSQIGYTLVDSESVKILDN